jgi:hypothetical protein
MNFSKQVPGGVHEVVIDQQLSAMAEFDGPGRDDLEGTFDEELTPLVVEQRRPWVNRYGLRVHPGNTILRTNHAWQDDARRNHR